MTVTGELTLTALKDEVASGAIDTVLVVLVDMQGRLVGKRLTAEFFLDVGHQENHACNYLLANDIFMEPVPGYEAANWKRGYGDFIMKPDLATLRRTAWLERTALVLCDVLDHPDHRPVAHSPRAILKAQQKRLADAGLMAYAASELEFYAFDEDYRTLCQRGYASPRPSGNYIQDYHIFQTTKDEALLRTMRNQLQQSGIPVESSKGEWGPGQHEMNVRYAEVLTAADRHVVMKNAMKEIAFQQGRSITFMSKWREDLAGSSCHVHMSLWDKVGSTPLFLDNGADYGMSALLRQFMAGLIHYARHYTYFLAPYVNSYKRFRAGTFAPTRIVWSRDNRTVGFRLCGEGGPAIRCETRIGGADLNPHLAFAALLAAGLQGIEEELELAAPFEGDAYAASDLQEIPSSLRESVEALDCSRMLRAAFGDAVVDHYVHTGRWEQAEYDRSVTDWEMKRGFEQC